MKQSLKMVLTLSSILLLGGVSALAEDGHKSVGFGVSAVEHSPEFNFRAWMGKQSAIDFSFGMIRIEPGGSAATATRMLPGLAVTYHLRPDNNMRPYFGAGVGLDRLSVGGNSVTDVLFGPILGFQYFFSNDFAVAGEYRIQVLMTDENGSASLLVPNSTYISTTQKLVVYFYL